MDQEKQGENDQEEDQFAIDSAKRVAPFIDRYFTKFYYVFEPFSPVYAFLHSNKLYMIGITQDHPIIKSTASIKDISFTPIGAETSKTFVKGKKKKGAIKINYNTVLAKVTLSDDTVHEIRSVIEGYIIEINENLFNDIQSLKNYPESEGFVAFVQPTGISKKNDPHLIDHLAYSKLIN